MNYKTIQINSIWRKTSPPSDEYVQFNTDKQTITLGVSRYTGIHDNSDIKKKKKWCSYRVNYGFHNIPVAY